MASSKTEKKTLWIVFFTIFLDLVGFGIIIPIQPFFAESLGASPTVVTLLGASFSLMQFLFAPVWGRLSDRVGRRPVMLVSLFASTAGYFFFARATTLPSLFAARMLAGFGSANIGTAQAIIADSTSAEKRARGMGLIGAAFGLGFIFGPAIGGFFGQFGLSAPAYVASLLCGLNFLFALAILPETLASKVGKSTTTFKPISHFSIEAFTRAMRHPNVRQLFAIFLFWAVAFSLMEQALGLYIERVWVAGGMEHSVDHAKQAGLLTAIVLIVVGLTATIVQGALIGRLAKLFGEKRLVVAGTLTVALCYLLIPAVGSINSFALFITVFVFHAFGTGVTNPSLSSLLSRSVDSDEQGGVLGMGQSLAALGRIIGPAMSGMLFEKSIGLPFWVAAVFTGVVTLTALIVTQPSSLVRDPA